MQRIVKDKEKAVVNLIGNYEYKGHRPLKYPIVKSERGTRAIMLPENIPIPILRIRAAAEEAEVEKILWKERAEKEMKDASKWLKEQERILLDEQYEKMYSDEIRNVPLDVLQKAQHTVQKQIDHLDIMGRDRIPLVGDVTKRLRELRDRIDGELRRRSR